MNAAQAILNAISNCGQEVSICHSGETFRFPACIQPRSYDTLQLTRDAVTRFGSLDPREFVYYGPSNYGGEFVVSNALIFAGKHRYCVTIWHDFLLRGQPIFRWAVLRQDPEEAI